MLDRMTGSIVDASPASVGLDADRLARIDRHLRERYVEPGKLPFASFTLARDGRVVHRTRLGRASLATGAPVGDETLVRIYSMTKPIASVALMMLVEEGRIALDDAVAAHIPSFARLRVFAGGGPDAFETVPLAAPLRVVDLLRHTSGLTYDFQARTPVDAAYRARRLDPLAWTGTLESFVDALADVPLEFQPGSCWNYGVSTDVVGRLVEVVSGVPFERFLAERILGPLGMRDTGFHVREGDAARFADCYARDASGALVPHHLRDFRRPVTCPSGGGGLVSTAGDYLRFCECVRRGGELDGVRLLGPRTVAFMRRNHLPDGRDLPSMSVAMFSEGIFRGTGFGLGFAVVENPVPTTIASTPGEIAWGGLASTAFWIDPIEGLSAVFLTQLIPSSTYPVRRELRTLVNAAIVESRA